MKRSALLNMDPADSSEPVLRGGAQSAPEEAADNWEAEQNAAGEQFFWDPFEETAPDLGVGTSAYYL